MSAICISRNETTTHSVKRKKYIMDIIEKRDQKRKRVGWITYNIYCPLECSMALKSYFRQWKKTNIARWYIDEVTNRPEGKE
jgi:lysyl-tRNA synthetase class I